MTKDQGPRQKDALDEAGRVALLNRVLSRGDARVSVGIGDDAAVIRLDGQLVASVDEAVEGVHFERAWLSFEDIGYRSTMAALSDLAAMGARPCGVLASLVCPADLDDAALEALARGQAEACDACGTAVVGGNLSRGPVLSLATTVLGACAQPLLRAGARAGDGLWLAGELGLAARGLEALQQQLAGRAREIAAWRRPRARIAEGMAAAALAHAAIDISDGLALDASRLADASGVALWLSADALGPDRDATLYGGEDYALLAASPVPLGDGFRRIGRCAAGDGVWLEDGGDGERIAPRGWDHFG